MNRLEQALANINAKRDQVLNDIAIHGVAIDNLKYQINLLVNQINALIDMRNKLALEISKLPADAALTPAAVTESTINPPLSVLDLKKLQLSALDLAIEALRQQLAGKVNELSVETVNYNNRVMKLALLGAKYREVDHALRSLNQNIRTGGQRDGIYVPNHVFDMTRAAGGNSTIPNLLNG